MTTRHKYFSGTAQHNTLHTSYLYKTVLKRNKKCEEMWSNLL